MPYYLTRPDYDTCNGMGLWSLDAAMVVLTAATPMKQAMDFPIDLMVLDGSAQFGGGVKLGDKTAYSDKTGKRDHYLQEKYDFDGDEAGLGGAWKEGVQDGRRQAEGSLRQDLPGGGGAAGNLPLQPLRQRSGEH